MLYWTARQT
jgi:hypothetical protein